MQKNIIKYNKFVCEFHRKLNEDNVEKSNIVFLCIGTDRITGDCFGPIVGYKLQENNNLKLNVYGTLEKPVNALNLKDKIKEIYINYENPYIVAIDAALSKKENIGKIIINNNFLQAGNGIKNCSINIGNISIRAVIGKKEETVKKNMEKLQNTSLNMIMNLAKIVSDGIMEVMSKSKNLKVYKYE